MKKRFVLLLALALLLPGGSVMAQEQTSRVSGDYTYSLLEDGTAEITEYAGDGGSVEVPGTLDGIPVSAIGDYAFSWAEGIRSLAFPESLERIGNWAFVNCTGLVEVVIPDSVTHIGDGAFTGCENLAKVTFGLGIVSLGGNPFVATPKLLLLEAASDHPALAVKEGALILKPESRLVSYLTGLKQAGFTVPEGIREIGGGAFYGAKRLKSILLPESLVLIGDNAFTNCAALTELDIPASVSSIGSGAFMGCERLAAIVIPEGVTRLGDEVFSSCTRLKSVTLPEGLAEIGGAAFAFCESLRSLHIPLAVASIGRDAFIGCQKLTLTLAGGSYAQGYADEFGLKYKLQ